MFWIILIALLVIFAAGFFVVKSGRLTVYMAAITGALASVEPILQTLIAFDFSAVLDEAQRTWLLLVSTVLVAVSRKRREIMERFE